MGTRQEAAGSERCGDFHPLELSLTTTQPNMVKESRVKQPSSRGVQVPDKVLRYASYGSLTAGGPAEVVGSAPDVLSVLSLIRAV